MRLPLIPIIAANKALPRGLSCADCNHDPVKCETTPEYVLRALEARDLESLKKSREIILRILNDSHKDRLDPPELRRQTRNPLSEACLAEKELGHVNRAIAVILENTRRPHGGTGACAERETFPVRRTH